MQPRSEIKDAEAVEAVRKATERGEVHAIGVSSPGISSFTNKDVTDWPKLVLALRERKNEPTKVVWSFLPEKTEELVTSDDILEELRNPQPGQPISERALKLKMGVTDALHKMIFSRDTLYQANAFKDFALEDSTKMLIARAEKRTAWQTSRMNWELLATIFPGSIASAPSQLMTIHVRVDNEKDTILVLSSYMPCRWSADIKPGSKVTGIVLCGHHAQEVTVVNNPVQSPIVYRARDNPDGSPRENGSGHFYGYDKKHKGWSKFVAGVKEITGKEFASFQGVNVPETKDGPHFVVPPKAK